MKVIRDCRGRVVCMADPRTGRLEAKYCKQIVRLTLGIGESITLEREGTITTITRLSVTDLRVVT